MTKKTPIQLASGMTLALSHSASITSARCMPQVRQTRQASLGANLSVALHTQRVLNLLLKILALLAFALPSICMAQSAEESLNKRLEEILKTSGFPGFAITISKGDSTVYARAFGYADKSNKKPYTLDTVQPVGSVSKTVIGLAIIKAVELGQCALDADINESLPFKVQNPYRPNDRITLRHLATHTSGLLDNEATYRGAYELGTQTSASMAKFLADYYSVSGKHYNKANFFAGETGKRYAYSNIASALAAYIVERNTKMPFDAFTEKYIFAPLQMSSTHWFYREAFTQQYATLYEVNKQSDPLYQTLLNADRSLKPYSTVTYPDGSLRSSANDLTKYIKALNRSHENQAVILRRDSFTELLRKQFDTTNMPTDMDRREPNRGLFWAYARNGAIRHTGSDPGVFAFVSLQPETRIGRVFMMNAQLDGDDNALAVKSFMGIVEALDKFTETLK
jgi:CubicO group peptidase (beta-lactamase class C family)